jgi:hypothetical protein
MRYKRYPLALLSVAALAGCTVIDQTMTMTGAPPQPTGTVVTLYLSDFAPYASSPFVHRWDVWITSVDGKPVGPKDRAVQLSVGSHRFTYSCLGRIVYAQVTQNTDKGTFTFDLKPSDLGRQYYPVGEDNVRGLGTVTVAYFVAHGRCDVARLTTTNPETAEELGQSY